MECQAICNSILDYGGRICGVLSLQQKWFYQTFDLCRNRQKKYHFNFTPTFLRNVVYMLPKPMSLWSITSKEANVGICTL